MRRAVVVAAVVVAGAVATPLVARRVAGARDRVWAERDRQQQAARDSVQAEIARRLDLATDGELGIGAPTEAPGTAEAADAGVDAAAAPPAAEAPGLVARAGAWLRGRFAEARAVAPEDTLPDSLLVPKALADSLGLRPGETLVRPGRPTLVVPHRYD